MSDVAKLIARVRELDAGATPGPWVEMTTGRETYIEAPAAKDGNGIYIVAYADATDRQTAADFALAAKYRTIAPKLADMLARAMECVEYFSRNDWPIARTAYDEIEALAEGGES